MSKIYTSDEVKRFASYFPNWRQFRKIRALKDMARFIARNDLIDRYFPGDRRTSSGHDLSGLKELARLYARIIDFIHDYPSVYAYIAKNKLQYTVFTVEQLNKDPGADRLNEIRALAETYTTMAGFAKDHPRHLAFLRRRGLVGELFPQEKRNRRLRSEKRYSPEKLRALVSKYPSLTEFQKHQRRAYEYIKYHNLQGDIYPSGYSKRKDFTRTSEGAPAQEVA